MCNNTCYTCVIIKSIRHKGLLLFYETGRGAKLPSQYLRKINRLLDQLDAVSCEEDILALGQGVHKLTGSLKEFWSVKVSPNYRIIFRYEKGDVFDLDYIDYH